MEWGKGRTLGSLAELQADAFIIDERELLRRPIEECTVIDFPATKRVDDALSVRPAIGPNEDDTYDEVKIHFADTGLLLPRPHIWQHAINERFTRTLEDGEQRTTLLPISLYDKLSLDSGHALGTPAVTLRYLCDKSGRTTQFDVYKSRVKPTFHTFESFGDEIEKGDEEALYMLGVASRLGSRLDRANTPAQALSYEMLARFIKTGGQLLAAALADSGEPWVYRTNPEAQRARLQDLDVEALDETVADLLDSMGMAKYSTLPEPHLTLGYREFVHYASPLRRTADFIISLQLHALLTGRTMPFDTPQLEFHLRKLNALAWDRLQAKMASQETLRVAA